MKRTGLFLCTFLLGHTLFAQEAASNNKMIMNYNGHWYVPGDNSLDKEALHYQQLIKEKSAFDTLARGLDKYLGRDQYNEVSNNLDKLLKSESMMPGNTALIALLQQYVDMTKALRNNIVGKDDYRRQMGLASARILKARSGGWSDDLYAYIINESIANSLAYLKEQARLDNSLMMALLQLKKDERYQNCDYNIIVDNRMLDDPDMEMFICDRMEYILGADIYRYRESTPGIIKNYNKRKKESADMMGWLLQRATQDKAPFVMPISFSHNTGDKLNEENLSLSKNQEWYVFLFYKGFLYYSDALPKCGDKATVTILYKP
ncbi:MAG: hypothetical protein BGO70_13695 [Bacteroidetes bacterium 43-93]|nr:hypothetical protein [Bacteroidota bacterium]OJW99488.1 MAG: hypothetical protein BGO70_13695 [Bacteroidetes bacterium 43-93]